MSAVKDDWGRPLGHCKNRACIALVHIGSEFCCGGCSAADGKFDPDGYHSPGCVKRQAERGITVTGEAFNPAIR